MKRKIKAVEPEVNVEIITTSSRGDVLQDVSLHTVEGSDFFTEDIFNALKAGEADIAVHSLKDMSSEHFFGSNRFAVVDRDDVRDIAIFQKDILEKIKYNKSIIIGTCSPRREEMAIGFLQRALPHLSDDFIIETKSIRGNIDTRLKKLDDGEYDGIILATAGLNRLLESEDVNDSIHLLLRDKRLMLLPLIECVPAPCQGAIVAEADPLNKRAVELLNKINHQDLEQSCVLEKQIAAQYGAGCLQRFGVTVIQHGNREVVYAAGKNSSGETFSSWTGLAELNLNGKKLYSTTDVMGKFFGYDYPNDSLQIDEPVVYIANYKAVKSPDLIRDLQQKKIWAAGTKTWFELAKLGIWVEGCADAFGLEFLLKPWQMPLLQIDKTNVAVLTNSQSELLWQSKGWKTYASYNLVERYSVILAREIEQADIIFWTSFRQFLQYKYVFRDDVVHCCPYGETAEQLKKSGIGPVVFPTIKAFQQWRLNSIPLPSVG